MGDRFGFTAKCAECAEWSRRMLVLHSSSFPSSRFSIFLIHRSGAAIAAVSQRRQLLYFSSFNVSTFPHSTIPPVPAPLLSLYLLFPRLLLSSFLYSPCSCSSSFSLSPLSSSPRFLVPVFPLFLLLFFLFISTFLASSHPRSCIPPVPAPLLSLYLLFPRLLLSSFLYSPCSCSSSFSLSPLSSPPLILVPVFHLFLPLFFLSSSILPPPSCIPAVSLLIIT